MGQRTVYIGSFTIGSGGEGRGLSVVTQDTASGRLTATGEVAETVSPAFLAWHPTGRFLYAVNERTQGSVVAFAVRPTSDGDGDGDGRATLEEIGSAWTDGNGPCHLTVHPSGHYLLVANYGSGTLTVHPLDADGRPGPHSDLVQHAGSGPDAERQEGPHAHHIRVDPSGRWVLAVDLGMDAILTYTVELDTGRLAPGPTTQTAPGTGPRHLAFDANDERTIVYAAGELSCAVTSYRLDLPTGRLEPIATVPSTARPPSVRTWPSELALRDDRRFLYVANRGSDLVGTLELDGNGGMSPVADVPTGGAWPRHLAVIGDHLYVANERSHEVTHFRLGGTSGSGVPELADDRLAVPSPACVLPAPVRT